MVSQDMLLDIIRENTDEFEMELEDAIKDALAQLESRNIDTSSLVTSSSRIAALLRNETPMVLSDMELLKTSTDVGQQLKTLLSIQEHIKSEKSNQTITGSNGVLELLIQLLSNEEEPQEQQLLSTKSPTSELKIECCRTWIAVCWNHSQNKEFIKLEGIAVLLNLLNSSDHTELSRVALGAITASVKNSESNKKLLRDGGGLKTLLSVTPHQSTVKALAGIWKTMTVNDDKSSEFSQAHEVIREVVSDGNLIQTALKIIESHRSDPDIASAWILVLKQLAVMDDHCEILVNEKALETVADLMSLHDTHSMLLKYSIAMLRNIVACDQFKQVFVTRYLSNVLTAMESHSKDASIQEQGCATIAVTALRHPELCIEMVNNARVSTYLAKAIHCHQDSVTIIRQASLAVRNLVSRTPELAPSLLSENIEPVLRAAQGRRGCGDEAYGALRDLGCDIQLASEKAGKANFNPTSKQSRELHGSISNASCAPFK